MPTYEHPYREEQENPLFSAKDFHTGVAVGTDVVSQRLKAEIEAAGTIPYSRFMQVACTEHFYGSGVVRFDQKEDFTTIPEQHPFFGAYCASVLHDVWISLGKPEQFQVVEQGPGQGVLAANLLHYTRELFPNFFAALSYTLVEVSHPLAVRQKERLASYSDKVTWLIGSATEIELPTTVGAFISNELPDAFPVERVARINRRVRQKYITIENGMWVEVWSEPTPEVTQFIEKFALTIEEENETAINLPSVVWQQKMQAALQAGAIFTVDYGGQGKRATGSYLAVRYYGKDATHSIRGAAVSDALANYAAPGQYDMTADVDFAVLEKIARSEGLEVAESASAERFFERLGVFKSIEPYIEQLKSAHTWQEYVRLFGEVEDAYTSLYGFFSCSQFYAHLITKNCTLMRQNYSNENQEFPVELEDFFVQLPVPLEEKYYTVDRTHVAGFDAESGKPTKMARETGGYLLVPPVELQGMRVMKNDGTLLYDFTDSEICEQFVQQSGYIH